MLVCEIVIVFTVYLVGQVSLCRYGLQHMYDDAKPTLYSVIFGGAAIVAIVVTLLVYAFWHDA